MKILRICFLVLSAVIIASISAVSIADGYADQRGITAANDGQFVAALPKDNTNQTSEIEAFTQGEEISWAVYDQSYNETSLELGGSNGRLSKVFGDGEIPYLNMVESDIPDGIYSYRLTTKDPAQADDLELLAWAKQARDRQIYEETAIRLQLGQYKHQTVSGKIEVANGVVRIFDPDNAVLEEQHQNDLQEMEWESE